MYSLLRVSLYVVCSNWKIAVFHVQWTMLKSLRSSSYSTVFWFSPYNYRVELILLCFFCLLIRLQGLTTHHRTNIWCKRYSWERGGGQIVIFFLEIYAYWRNWPSMPRWQCSIYNANKICGEPRIENNQFSKL